MYGYTQQEESASPTPCIFSNNDKYQLKQEIDSLQKKDISKIFQIFQQEHTNYSKNFNGVFINLKNVPDETLVIIKQFIHFCKLKNNTVYKEQQSQQSTKSLPLQDSSLFTTAPTTIETNIISKPKPIQHKFSTKIPTLQTIPKLKGIFAKIVKYCKYIETW